ncbi:hypothetical protein L1987_43484 [Smallanthus sonchifolius]|uniref:Uncharacterized protein n=1 Tax=Smallanthus sonchifolius TaxID=185202 RepID=A0ACB9GN11_9ASTR|nr:hypothetical protein L1987_43484 [Smallanthus sonchifolius]
MVPVSVPKVGKLSLSLPRTESCSVAVVSSSVGCSHSSLHDIISLGNESCLGVPVNPTCSVIPSSNVSPCVSSTESFPLLSYPSWSTSVTSFSLSLGDVTPFSLDTSLASASKTIQLLDSPGSLLLSSGKSPVEFPTCGSPLDTSVVARDFVKDAKRSLALKHAQAEVACLSDEIKVVTDKLASVEKEMDQYQLMLVNSQVDTEHCRMEFEDKEVNFCCCLLFPPSFPLLLN